MAPTEGAVVTAPFRFMDLPAEIRQIVYKKLFGLPLLTLCKEACDTITEYTKFKYHSCFHFPDNLPAILTVCRIIRTEALPIFAQSVIIGLADPPRPRATDHDLAMSRIPRHYLQSARVAYVDSCFKGLVSELLLPALEEVHLLFRGEINDRPEAPEDVTKAQYVQLAKEYFEKQNAGAGLQMRLSQGKPPFKVILHVQFKVDDGANPDREDDDGWEEETFTDGWHVFDVSSYYWWCDGYRGGELYVRYRYEVSWQAFLTGDTNKVDIGDCC